MPPQFDIPQWFVLRDLKRPNAKTPAHKLLAELGFETFTPMHWVIKDNRTGGKIRKYIPYIPSLLFTKSIKAELDTIIERTDTLQYRFVKGAPKNTPMTVPMGDMERFIRAVTANDTCIYYTPEEVTPDMIGKRVRIVGRTLDGTEGNLMKKRGSKKKRLILQLKDALVASVEVEANFIQPL